MMSAITWLISSALVLNVMASRAARSIDNASHYIVRRAANTTQNIEDAGGCQKTCTLIVIALVLAVFCLCLIGSIYYAAHQDKGETKHHQQELVRAAKLSVYTQPTYCPTNIDQYDSRFGSRTKSRNSPLTGASSIQDSDNYRYYYNANSYQGDVSFMKRNVPVQNKINENFESQSYPQSPMYVLPSSRYRTESAKDIYEADDSVSLGPRGNTLDNSFPSSNDERYYDSNNAEGYIEFDIQRYIQPPKSELMQRKLIKTAQSRQLKSALKNSKSLQDIPLETNQERKNIHKENHTKDYSQTQYKNIQSEKTLYGQTVYEPDVLFSYDNQKQYMSMDEEGWKALSQPAVNLIGTDKLGPTDRSRRLQTRIHEMKILEQNFSEMI